MILLSISSTNVNIVSKYLSATFYNRIPFTNPNIGVYYNSFTFDIISIIPIEFKESITEVSSFSDYICLVSDATSKIDTKGNDFGIIYVDSTKHSTDESINIAKLPPLQQSDCNSRKELLGPVLRDIYYPFWVKEQNENKDQNVEPQKDLNLAKDTIEKAIQNYCTKNSLARTEINSISQFIDHIAPDIFKFKMTVAEEMQLRKEAESLDSKGEEYPTMLLKAIKLLGLEK